MNPLKSRVLAGEAVLGAFLSLGDSVVTEMVAKVGYDWLLVDLEHGLGTEEKLIHQVQALASTRTEAIVRVENLTPQRIYRALDLGASGVMCPLVNSADEARRAIAAMHYPPHGNRGVAKMVRATDFAANFDDYARTTREKLLGIIQIETPAAVNCVEDIAQVDGCDVLFIGPADLSMALGKFGQLDHPDFVAATKKIIAAAQNAGKAVGFLLFNPDDYQKYYDLGIRFFACGTDTMFLRQGAQQNFAKLAQHRQQRP